MKINSVSGITQLCCLALLLPLSSLADQTDERLEALFSTLQSSKSDRVQKETELTIWSIWYDSGREDIDALMAEGRKAMQAGKLAEAEAIFTRITEIAPAFSEGWNRRATVRYHQNDYEGSLADIERTLALEPNHFGAIWGKGMIFGWQRDFLGAITAFEELLRIKPYSGEAVYRIELLKKEMLKNAV